jgi:hypothetical protein
MATAIPYKNPDEATAALNTAFAPANDAQKTAIAGAAALVPGAAATPSPIQRTIDPGAEAADKYLGSFKAPETADQIAERLRQGSQGSIDAINTVYDDKVKANQAIGQERLAQDNAISVLSGLTGSTEAGRTRGATLEKNDKEVQAINNERLMKTQAIYSQISQQALDEARAQREDATADANAIVARRKEAQAKTLDSLKAIAAGGLVDFDSFKSSPQNAQVYAHALDALGGSEQALRGIFAANRPQDQLVGTPTRVGDHFIQAYQNPLTGKISYDKVEVPGGLPAEYNNFQKIGDSLVAIPDGWDGDTSKLKVIAGGSGAAGASSNGLVDRNGKPLKLTAAQADTISGFDSTTQVANEALAMLQQGVQTGPIANAMLQGGKLLGIQDPSQLKMESTLGKLRADFMKAISGAAVSESEVKRLSTFLPNITDQETVIESKLNTLISETQRTKGNLLSTLGAADQGSAPDIRAQVTAAGYDYDAMRADGLTDAKIKDSLGL